MNKIKDKIHFSVSNIALEAIQLVSYLYFNLFFDFPI